MQTTEASIIPVDDWCGVLCDVSTVLFRADDALKDMTGALNEVNDALDDSITILCQATGSHYDVFDVLSRANDVLCDTISILCEARAVLCDVNAILRERADGKCETIRAPDDEIITGKEIFHSTKSVYPPCSF